MVYCFIYQTEVKLKGSCAKGERCFEDSICDKATKTCCEYKFAQTDNSVTT